MALVDFVEGDGDHDDNDDEDENDDDDDHSPSCHWASRQGMELAMRGRPHKTPSKDDDEDDELDDEDELLYGSGEVQVQSFSYKKGIFQ